ncbi:hypothetical protein A3D09_02185 [Candidatus Collierbacteria bacterium RIFCSPHIGHO2_02_FULL_49_10]|uniref:Uncharacterized protein n=1 Tax=Candidatus Collierbacteria bacterium RIFCSPHIGHO2_02_FULL_49_10 TaxID=1817723 RepID=A0A1F5EVX9_9BACT|nr:MAG: hypothetical protein A3D09_02185 [Candidatus Collierbacteria bacterium RIFCSPHIGHO2_02_FULL_49_10]
MDNTNYCPAQISFHIRRDDSGRLLEHSTMINIRAGSTDECYRQYTELKAKLNGELGEPVANKDEEEKIHLPELGKQCPECAGRMILRTAKRGSHAGERFWGCANYKTIGCLHTEVAVA